MAKYFLTIKNENTDEATIDIDGVIGESWWREEGEKENSLQRIKNELNKLKSSKAKTIQVNIHSLGGDVDHGLAIHDALKTHTAKVITSITGMCASAATIIFSAGDERIMSENSLFLIHKVSSCSWGNENDLQAELETHKVLNERLVNLYHGISIKTKEDIEALMEADNGHGKWITASEAKDFGFVTEIILQNKKVACVDRTTFLNAKLPNVPEGFEHLIQNEKDNETLWNKITQFIDEKITGNSATKKLNNTLEMKKLFPLLCVALALADDTAFDKDKGFTMSEDQMKGLEAKLKKIDELTDEATNLKNEVSTLKKEATEKDNKITELQNLVDNAGKPLPTPNGKDQNLGAENFEDAMKTNPNYQAAAADLGITF
jgi:ATP-dependent protease ClpP protease subunit/cell division protein FtsB